MDFQQPCPSATMWQEMLAGRIPAASMGDCARHLDRCRSCQAVVEGLTSATRTWLDIAAELRQADSPVPLVCRRTLDEINQRGPVLAHAHTVRRIQNASLSPRPSMTACIHLERMMHRSSIAVTGESAASYTLLKLIPTGLSGGPRPLALNLALALDVSGSMYEEDGTGISRLRRVQDAAINAIQKLRPQDTLAIVGFAQNARVLLPSTPLAEKERIEDVIRRIDTFDIDPGGTMSNVSIDRKSTRLNSSHVALSRI